MERPILFNTDMVKAILEGRKTQTRRVVKPQPKESHTCKLGFILDSTDKSRKGNFAWGTNEHGGVMSIAKPPYAVGDTLWVRETWSFLNSTDCGCPCIGPCNDIFNDSCGCYVYRTNYGTTEDNTFPPSMFKWKPSIHMPRSAARIFLKVTDVRVERLQDIIPDDVLKEGLTDVVTEIHALDMFAELWNSIYGNWQNNPWVWVIEFERMV